MTMGAEDGVTRTQSTPGTTSTKNEKAEKGPYRLQGETSGFKRE
jgi:hypothetical protein